MADFSTLIASIEETIKTNGVQAITGQILQDEMLLMVSAINQLKQDTLEGYAFYGEPLADGGSASVTQNTFFLVTAGTYTINGNTFAVTSEGVSVVVYDSVNDEVRIEGLILPFDNAPTDGSSNPVTSGGAYTALAGKQALVPAATNGNLAEFDNAGQVRDAGVATADIATKDGAFPDLFAGYAGNLVDTRSAGTPQGPYAFRQSGGDGVDYMVRIKGRTEAFNQLVQNGNFADTSNWSAEDGISFSVSSNEAHLSMSGGAYTSGYLEQIIQLYAGHNYLICFAVKCGNAGSRARILTYGGEGAETLISWANYSAWTNVRQVVTATKNNNSFRIYADNALDNSGDVSVDVKNFFMVDLTLEGLGFTTADQFRALHPLPYYNPMSKLINNAATGIKSRGFNAWDEEWENGYIGSDGSLESSSISIRSKNYCPCLPSAQYYFNKGGNINDPNICWYDANKAFISRSSVATPPIYTSPSNAAYFKISCYGYGATYNHDICINLSDASRNGTYEPYWERTLALGLNSIPCHDENNNAVVVNGLDGVGSSYDEAVVENGMVTKIIKRFAEVDMGTLGWSYSATYLSFYVQVPNLPAGFNKALLNTKAINSKFATLASSGIDPLTIPDKTMQPYNGYLDQYLVTKDSAYIDAATFKAAVAGVKFRYELATPKVLTLDNPIPALIEVDNLGTEKRLPEDTADAVNAPFESDSNYSVSVANLVRKLSE